ncbi:sulfur carrier protein ThiS [Thermosipho ferrireducens]|uniref:Sulfur carrier protein ThiS n=1 Tax=Thermosipho ferrireducens TaxID=2571116 RepID=A0ABX7S7V2_9BACT|nr:sulfur carrier protein ThiS [Thermosipho ferrireducens]QTA37926.1 sulfur carrier protein ThiS [Thermosipho ferrireducens]
MKISVNGKEKVCKASSVKELLEELLLVDKPIVVVLNGNIVSVKDYPEIKLSENDKVEIITVVGGG